ncbi:hypothetical protein [Gordonia aurantiaca]
MSEPCAHRIAGRVDLHLPAAVTSTIDGPASTNGRRICGRPPQNPSTIPD